MIERIGHIREKVRLRIGRIYPLELRKKAYGRKDQVESEK